MATANGSNGATSSTSQSKVAIITGATSGMGLELAKHLHSKGWKVALVGRRAELGVAAAKEINDEENARFFSADVSDYHSQAAMFNAVWTLWGRLDLLCINAGIVDKGSLYIYGHRNTPIGDLPPEPDLSCTDIDYKGCIYGIMLATHFMRHNKPDTGGKIVVNTSIGGVFPHRTYPEYCGAKAAVIHYVRNVAPLLKSKENIFVNAVMPGCVDTSIVPPEMTAAVTPECLTPMSTIMRAHDMFIEDDSGLAGETYEGSSDKIVPYGLPEYGNGYKTQRAVTVWEPLFRMMHGEDSGMKDAIP